MSKLLVDSLESQLDFSKLKTHVVAISKKTLDAYFADIEAEYFDKWINRDVLTDYNPPINAAAYGMREPITLYGLDTVIDERYDMPQIIRREDIDKAFDPLPFDELSQERI